MATLTVRDSKTGKVLRKVDGKTGRVISKSSGSSSSISRNNSSSSSSSSRNNSSSSSSLPEGAIASKVGGGFIYAPGREPTPEGAIASRAGGGFIYSNPVLNVLTGGGSSSSSRSSSSRSSSSRSSSSRSSSSRSSSSRSSSSRSSSSKDISSNSSSKITSQPKPKTLAERLRVQPQQQLTEAQKLKRAGFNLQPMQFEQNGQFGTITPEQLRQQQQIPTKRFSFTPVTEAEKRFFKGEDTFQFNTGQEIVVGKGGKARSLTQKEVRELELERNPQLVQEIKVNPLRVLTGATLTGASTRVLVENPDLIVKGVRNFISNPLQSTAATASETQRLATRDPFNLIGQFYAFAGGGKVAKEILNFGTKSKNRINVKLDEINKKIEELKKDGVNTRQRTKEAEELRRLEAEKEILKDTDKLIDKVQTQNNKLEQLNKELKSKPTKEKVNKVRSNIKKTQEVIKKDVNSIAKKIDKSNLLEELSKQKIKEPRIKILKTLPKDVDKLRVLLENARKKSGLDFSRLKKKIKKDLNLNVVERKKGDKITYSLLEPKEQRKKGLVTGKKSKPKLIKLEPIKTIKLIEDLPKEKITLRELDKIEKQLKKDVARAKKKGFFMDKKGQIQIQKNTNKYTKKIKNDFNIIKSDIKNYVDRYKSFEKNKIRFKKENKLNKKNLQKLEQKRQNLNKQKNRLELKSKNLNKNKIKYASILALLKSQDLEKQLVQSLNNQLKELDNIKPKKEIENLPKPTITTPITTLRTTQTQTPTNRTLKEEKIKPRTNPRTTPTPKPKPRPKLKSTDKKKTSAKSTHMGEITYKTAKGKIKTVKTGLPFNKAKQIALKTVDNTTLASVTVKKYGKTKAKDIKPVDSSKFRLKKSKNPLVQKLVEKRSKRIDTKGEKKGLQASKYLATQLKKARVKKKSKK